MESQPLDHQGGGPLNGGKFFKVLRHMESTWNSIFSVHKKGFIVTKPCLFLLVSSVAALRLWPSQQTLQGLPS